MFINIQIPEPLSLRLSFFYFRYYTYLISTKKRYVAKSYSNQNTNQSFKIGQIIYFLLFNLISEKKKKEKKNTGGV